MSNSPPAVPGDAEGDPSSAEWVRRRFLAACDESLEGQPPDLDAYLSHVPEPDRSRLRGELESAGRNRRRRGPEDTALPPAPPEATIDYPPQVGGGATRPGASDATADRTADSPVVAVLQATVAPEEGKLAGTCGPAAVAGYEILGVLGRGAMGVVYKARQVGLNRIVALKMILSGDHAGRHERARFHSEAEAVARIQHLNIVQIYEIGEEDGRPDFSLEYVDGGSLSGKIHSEPQPPREAARIVHLLAGAMDCRPSGRGRPPRFEAGQCAADRRRHAEDHRLRPGQVHAGERRPDAERGHPRYARLHGPGTGGRQERRGGASRRRVRVGRHPVRAADGPDALPGADAAGNAGTRPHPRTGGPHRAATGRAARPGDDLF